MSKLRNLAGLALVASLIGCTQSIPVPITTIHAGPQTPPKYISYTVKPGDTLGQIASQYQMSYLALARLNNISSPYIIHVGQALQVPNPNLVAEQVAVETKKYGGEIKPISSQNSIPAQNLNFGATTGKVYVTPVPISNAETTANTKAKSLANQLISETSEPTSVSMPVKSVPVETPVSKPATTAKAINVNEAIQNKMVSPLKYREVDQINWSWPATGQIAEEFGQGKGLLAKGVQIVTASNAKVFAAADGSVIYSGMGVEGYGNMIIIKSDNNFLTAYTNLSKLSVKQGATVSRGDTLGIVGTINSQPTLHFEVRKFGNPVNPVKYMPPVAGVS